MSHYKETTRKGMLYAEAFKSKDVDLTIKSWTEISQKGEDGTDYMTELAFDETPKKLWLNTVNSESIASLAKSGERDTWVGITATFYPIKGKFFGIEREAIRVRPIKPTQKRDVEETES